MEEEEEEGEEGKERNRKVKQWQRPDMTHNT